MFLAVKTRTVFAGVLRHPRTARQWFQSTMLASVDSESHSGDALPVCLDGENSNRLVTGGHARTLTYVFEEPLDAPKGPLMEFRLIYEGPLPSGANNPHPKTKHSIRKA